MALAADAAGVGPVRARIQLKGREGRIGGANRIFRVQQAVRPASLAAGSTGKGPSTIGFGSP
jgi:hypothetical protein